MHDHDELDDTTRAALRAYRTPPEPPLDEMWRAIEARAFGAHAAPRRQFWRAAPTWLAAAAALAIGVGIGRYAVPAPPEPATPVAPRVAEAPDRLGATATVLSDARLDVPYEVATSRYLGATAALLIALPAEARTGQVDAQFASQARDLLQTTRLLLDSPAGDDPDLRALLSDLELVLAQVAGLRSARDRQELDLITGALEQRDVLPRLQSVVAQIPFAGD
ncbi:MAG TPA: hypothetical protein VK922_00415 [Gemmatimonadaceae bacterium]|nr:hypothetical protein [Gemmatimonadaceae bacterium]